MTLRRLIWSDPGRLVDDWCDRLGPVVGLTLVLMALAYASLYLLSLYTPWGGRLVRKVMG